MGEGGIKEIIQQNKWVSRHRLAPFSFRVRTGRMFRGSRSRIVLPVEHFPVLHFPVAIRSGLRVLRQIACLHRLPAKVFGGTFTIFRIPGDIDLRPLFHCGSPIPCRSVGKMSCHARPRPRMGRSRCHDGKHRQEQCPSLHFRLLDLRPRRRSFSGLISITLRYSSRPTYDVCPGTRYEMDHTRSVKYPHHYTTGEEGPRPRRLLRSSTGRGARFEAWSRRVRADFVAFQAYAKAPTRRPMSTAKFMFIPIILWMVIK